jgi:hypothetical protein
MVGCALIKNLKRHNMKIIKNILLLTACYIFVGCAKEEKINNTETQVGQSKVTFFVDLELNGPEYLSIVKDGSFTDPGATATENGKPVTVKIGTELNKSVPGLYRVSYSATNVDGFSKTVFRNVFVLPAAETPGVDLSGSYSLTGAALVSDFVKVAPGAYYGGNINHPSTPISGYFMSSDGINIIIPNQSTPYGSMNGSGTYTPGTQKIVWTINIPSQGYTRTRTFTRQ